SYTQGSVTLSGVGVGWSMIEARAKFFVGNSFYLTGGAGQRTFTFTSELTPLDGGPEFSAEAKATTLGATFAIGNQWQWDYFTLGLDWIGYFLPISQSGDSEVVFPGVVEDDLKELNDSLEELGKTPNLQVLRIYLGIAF